MDALPPVLQSLLAPFVDPASRTVWFAWVPFVLVALGVGWQRTGRLSLSQVFPRSVWGHASSRLDLQLLMARQLLQAAGLVVVVGSGAGRRGGG